MKVIKHKNFIRTFSILSCSVALSLLMLNCICACANESHKKIERNDNFLGFKDDELIYHFPGIKKEEIQHIPIIKISDYYYVTAKPLDVFPMQSPNIEFSFLTKNKNVSKLMKFSVDQTKFEHAISIHEKNYVKTIPQIEVFDEKIRNDAVYVTFLCNPDIIFEIDFTIWLSRQDGVSLSYHKTSPEDRQAIFASAIDNSYEATLLCNKNGYSEDKKRDFTIICKPLYAHYVNFDFDISKHEGTATAFDRGISYSCTYEKINYDNEFYYLVYISYTFLKNITPTYDEVQGNTPIIFTLNVYNDSKHVAAHCDFRIWWI